jgi:ubiquinone/menaquinone biosynthesis C-methylase UbiE
MDTPISKFEYQRMALLLSLRDLFSPPQDILAEARIEAGDRVLDYGCGLGSFTMAAAQRVGPEGKVYALDLHPLALKRVEKTAAKRGFTNIETIQSGCITRLASDAVDVILFYYILHWLTDPACVLGELHRVLKPGGTLSFRDPYLKEEEVLAEITGKGWFRLSGKGMKTYRFLNTGEKGKNRSASQAGISPSMA